MDACFRHGSLVRLSTATMSAMTTHEFLMGAALGLASCAAGAAGDIASGKAAFAACASCHQVGPSARNGFGPQLNGVVGRRAGSAADYRYSVAMKNSNIVWSEQSLAAFIKDPGGVVPGTRMRFSSLGFGDKKLADLLAYLQAYPMAK